MQSCWFIMSVHWWWKPSRWLADTRHRLNRYVWFAIRPDSHSDKSRKDPGVEFKLCSGSVPSTVRQQGCRKLLFQCNFWGNVQQNRLYLLAIYSHHLSSIHWHWCSILPKEGTPICISWLRTTSLTKSTLKKWSDVYRFITFPYLLLFFGSSKQEVVNSKIWKMLWRLES